MHYLIKQEKCQQCEQNDEIDRANGYPSIYLTHGCTNGYIETREDANEWLEQKLKEWGVAFQTNYTQHIRWQEAEGEK